MHSNCLPICLTKQKFYGSKSFLTIIMKCPFLLSIKAWVVETLFICFVQIWQNKTHIFEDYSVISILVTVQQSLDTESEKYVFYTKIRIYSCGSLIKKVFSHERFSEK